MNLPAHASENPSAPPEAAPPANPSLSDSSRSLGPNPQGVHHGPQIGNRRELLKISLGALGVEGVMADPKLELFDNDNGGKKIGENDNWGGDVQLAAVSTSAGAFALAGATTKDAVMLVTLAPGAYSARLSAATGTGGMAIVEVYEVR